MSRACVLPGKIVECEIAAAIAIPSRLIAISLAKTWSAAVNAFVKAVDCAVSAAV